MSDKLWLPQSARRRLRQDRINSTDYKTAASIDPEGNLTYDAFIAGCREEWHRNYTAAERQGPISFEHYMGLQFETLNWRITDEIPNRKLLGSIDSIEEQACSTFFRRLRDFTERYLRTKGVL